MAVGLCVCVIYRQGPWFPGAVRQNWLWKVDISGFCTVHFAQKSSDNFIHLLHRKLPWFFTKSYKSLSNFGFPRHDSTSFPSQRNKTSPREIQTECTEKWGWLRPGLFPICSPFADQVAPSPGDLWVCPRSRCQMNVTK